MTDFRRRYSDKAPARARQHISRLAFVLAGLLIAVTSVSLLFVGYVATQASTRQAIANEDRLFQSVLSDKLRAIIREQTRITLSDRSVDQLVRGFTPAYARESFDALWTNYRHNKIMLISGDGTILAESFDDYTHIISRPVSETPAIAAILNDLRDQYGRNRVRVPGGFGHRSLLGIEPTDYASMGFVLIDGKPALYGAMPVIPDAYKTTLPDGPPTILLSALYLDAALLRELNSHLEFAKFGFTSDALPSVDGPLHPVFARNGEALGTFHWQSVSSSSSIWPTIIPVIVLLSVALAALAFGIAWRIGRLTSSLQASEQQNRYLALHDTLSGLGNRLQFNRVLASSVQSLPNDRFAVLHCDLDKFKDVNDTYGHAAGDTVIREMAARLSEAVGRQGLVCRIGGDEFMIIFRKDTSRHRMRMLCDALITAAQRPISLSEGKSARIGLSIGIARAPEDGSNAEDIVSRSDAALYHSKDQGRSRYSFFSDLPDGNRPKDPAAPDTGKPPFLKKANG